MKRAPARLALSIALLALAFHLDCEKEIHRAARRTFQDIMARNLPPEQQAAALEEFVGAYPEPKTNPNLSRAFGMLAEHHARAGRPDIAASWYERAVRVNPYDPDLLNSLGYHYARNGMNLDRAVSVLEAAVRLAEERRYTERRQGFFKDSLGWALKMRGDLPRAVVVLEEATRLAPGVGVIQGHLAEAYRAIGERDRAASLTLDLYLKGRGTSRDLRNTLRALGAEGGPAYAREVERRIASGMRRLEAADRRETEASGASLVRIRADDGQGLSGSLFRPRGGPARGGVLLLHPLASSRAACSAFASAIAARGLWALAIDVRGHGSSVSETLPDARAFNLRLAESVDAAARDVRAGLGFLARQPGAGARRLGIFGAGMGALLAARAAIPHGAAPRPSALVLLSPWGRPDVYRDPLSRISPDAVLLLAGAEEDGPLATVTALSETPGSAAPESRIVAGAGSNLGLAVTNPDLAGAIAAFLESRLVRAPLPAAAPTN